MSSCKPYISPSEASKRVNREAGGHNPFSLLNTHTFRKHTTNDDDDFSTRHTIEDKHRSSRSIIQHACVRE
jgi:hypothetical protein